MTAKIAWPAGPRAARPKRCRAGRSAATLRGSDGSAVKRAKRIAIVLGAGFLAFAPPGTLIFLGMLVVGLVGNAWLVAGGALGLTALGVGWWLWARANRRTKTTGSTESV